MAPPEAQGVREGRKWMRDAIRRANEGRLRGSWTRQGERVAGVRRVSIQLPRISSGRGDSPPRICHLRGRDCPRIPVPARFSKYYDNIYPRTLLRDRPIRGGEKSQGGRVGLFISAPPMNSPLSRVIYVICFKVSRRVNARRS